MLTGELAGQVVGDSALGEVTQELGAVGACTSRIVRFAFVRGRGVHVRVLINKWYLNGTAVSDIDRHVEIRHEFRVFDTGHDF